MIVTRAPLRLPLGGGGTDIVSYAARFGGFVISSAIDKYVYISVNKPQADELIRLKYSKSETVTSVDEIENELIKEALKVTGIENGVEITAMADVPDGTGLGSSGSFLVALLLALHRYKREPVSPRQLAEEASYIEIDVLGHPIGKHDQYLAAYGGLTTLEIDNSNSVKVIPSSVSRHTIRDLESFISLFYTGILRKSNDVLKKQDASTKNNETAVIESLHRIKEIGIEIRDTLVSGRVEKMGTLFDRHWKSKINLSEEVAGSEFIKIYDRAIATGAGGGKLVGAGGGGFFAFFANGSRSRLRQAMQQIGLREVPIRFESEGAKVIVDF